MSGKNGNDRGGLRRPRRGDKSLRYAGKCDIRLSAEEDSILNELANRNRVSRSDVMRRALMDFARFNGLDEE